MTDETTSRPRESDGEEIMRLFVEHLKRRLKDLDNPPTAAEGSVIVSLLRDNSITLASIKRGDFGKYAKKVADEFPFPGDEDTPPEKDPTLN